ncbi:hypothetical protein D0501_02575 [Leuconostoc holzapfelii]|uniref:Helix-turn-helix domain-containing protein n=1 Tax=Leuconostoc holzapfelii TaxID=434464 RepID=A0ABT2NUZ9_9LACO|nr:hypothetical protein [Leuconostoc holzapfelii]MCT8388982.1 hypothetical protein [Leuconostoc holzapfelii]
MAASNDELMEKLSEMNFHILQAFNDLDDKLNQPRRIWKRAEKVAEHFDVSLGTVKSWKRQGLITGYKHDKIVIYDITAIERELFKVNK